MGWEGQRDEEDGTGERFALWACSFLNALCQWA